jgi:diaminopimelate dehydrogenase
LLLLSWTSIEQFISLDPCPEKRSHLFLLERAGTAGAGVHDTLLLEGRFDPTAFTARAMLDAARRLPGMSRGLQRYCG